MLAALEADHPEPSAVPDDPACAVIALVLEDYGDEWLNKCMFQQRWGQSPDREAAALRVLVQLYDGKRPRAYKAPQTQIAERMAARLPLVGAEAANRETLDSSWRRFALRLNDHLQQHLFIFGGRPSVADFAIAAQFQQMLIDPTPAAWFQDRAPTRLTSRQMPRRLRRCPCSFRPAGLSARIRHPCSPRWRPTIQNPPPFPTTRPAP